jgi:hypothetical protein
MAILASDREDIRDLLEIIEAALDEIKERLPRGSVDCQKFAVEGKDCAAVLGYAKEDKFCKSCWAEDGTLTIDDGVDRIDHLVGMIEEEVERYGPFPRGRNPDELTDEQWDQLAQESGGYHSLGGMYANS